MAESQVSGLIEQVQLGATAHSIASTAYGICDSSASTPGKEVNMTGFDLKPGVTVHIKFINENTAENPTLSISGSIAKPLAITNWASNSILSLTYDNISDTWIYNTSGKVPFNYLPTGTTDSTVAIGNHTHSLNNLTKKALTTSTINTNKTTDIIYSSSAGKFFGHTSNVDWVGLQFGTSNDRFQLVAQLVADSNTLLFRQNDYASPTASNWSAWQQFVHIPFNGGNGGAGNSGSKEEGSETVATPVYIATNGTATPIAYTIGSDVPIGAEFTDKYHKTGSWNGLTYTADAVNSADELAFTIPTGTSSTTVAVGNHNHNSTYLKLNGSNNMNDDVNIIVGEYDKFVNFWYDTNKKAGASWRLGLLGTGLEDAKYFVIQSGNSTISDTNWTNALRIGMNTHNIYIPSTTPSTSTSTGALTVGGGLGVAGQVTATSLHGTLATTDLSGIVSITARKFLKDTGDWTQVDWDDLTGTPTMTSISTPNTLVERDANGDFSARNITMAQGNIGSMTLSETTITALTQIATTGDLLHIRNGTNSTILDTGNYSTTGDTRYYKLDGSNTGTTLKISTQTSAYTNQIQFMNNTTKKGSVGCDNNGAMCMYGASKIALRPILDASTDGVEITTSAMIPTKNNTMILGGESNKWATVYATTFDGTATSLTHIANAYDGLRIKYNTTIDFFIGVGTGNINHGLYDYNASGGAKWILSAGSNNVWTFVGNVTGNATTATTATKVAVTAHTNTTNGSKSYKPWFSTESSGNLSAKAFSAFYLYETVTSGAISKLDLCVGSSSITGTFTLWDGSSYWGNIKTTNLSANRNYELPNASGTIALTSSNITGNADTATTATNLSTAPTITQIGSSGTILSAATFYTLTIGGQTVVFKTPIDINDQVTQNIKTDNKKYGIILSNYETNSSVTTEAAVNRDSKVYVNPSLNSVNAGQFVLHDKAATPVEKAYMVWNATDQSIDFVFN